MKACLDPNVAIVSPSLETRFLTGVALSAAVGLFQTTTDISDVSPGLVQGLESYPVVESVAPSIFETISSLIAGEETDIVLSADLLPSLLGLVEQGIISFLDAFSWLFGLF